MLDPSSNISQSIADMSSVADRVLLLYNSRLYLQTSTQDSKASLGGSTWPAKTSHIVKQQEITANSDKSRRLNLNDAEGDSSRRTGDIAIYGMVYIHSPCTTLLTQGRVLPECDWPLKRTSINYLYRWLFILFYIRSVCAQMGDSIATRKPEDLYSALCCNILRCLGSN
jgi:hypothetical protein